MMPHGGFLQSAADVEPKSSSPVAAAHARAEPQAVESNSRTVNEVHRLVIMAKASFPAKGRTLTECNADAARVHL